jgi:uncharacterized protein YggU (UPF0235/DUF167 family)
MTTKRVPPPPTIWIKVTCPKMKRNKFRILGQSRITLGAGGNRLRNNSRMSLIRLKLGRQMRSERHIHRHLTRMRGQRKPRASSSLLLTKVSSWNISKTTMKVRISSPSLRGRWLKPLKHSLEGALKVSRSNLRSNQGGDAWPKWFLNL